MKNHKSHHIFLYLGLLVLVFIIFFGIRYFQGSYLFEDTPGINNTGSYDDGINVTNRFEPTVQSDIAMNPSWQIMRKDNLIFAYPKEYQLDINNQSRDEYELDTNNQSLIRITAPYSINDDCDDITDEQLRAFCLRPQLSPNISITTMVDNDNPFFVESNVVMIDGEPWQRSGFNDEYSGMVWFRGTIKDKNIEVSYTYNDINGGQSFESLQTELGEQYQLTQQQQEKLARDIISTIEIN